MPFRVRRLGPEPFKALHELKSKLLVSPLIAPVIGPYITPYITPFKEFSL